MFHYNADHPLRRYFSGLAEHAFLGELGVADPPLIDYLSELLSRFISMDAIHRFQAAGRSFEQVAELLLEAEAFPPEGRTYRDAFWSANPAAGRPAFSHRIAPGETLSSISQRYYGTPARWQEIVAANADVLSDQRSFTTGKMLRIP